MGYHTEFDGAVFVSPPLNAAEVAYLTAFNESRRWDRPEGPYGTNDGGGYRRGSMDRYNRPPAGQPQLWCPWRPTPDGTALVWDGCEKPYEGEEWLRYLINHFLAPGAVASGRQPVPSATCVPDGLGRFTFDHVLSGGFHAQGEGFGDVWTLIVEDNRVRRAEGHVPLSEPVTVTVERVDVPGGRRVIAGTVIRGEVEGG